MTSEDEGSIAPDAGILTQFESNSVQTIVAFGGLTTEGETPVFEFFRFLSDYDVRKVFLRDDQQAWYQLGARGMGESIDEVQESLFDLLGTDGCRHAVFTGGSMGGYAAMFFGARLGAGEVQAFAPQTYLDRVRRRYYKDFRRQRAINHMRTDLGRRRSYFDLRRPLARAARHRAVPIHIHVANYEPDLVHAERVGRVPGVSVHPCPEITDHRIARASTRMAGCTPSLTTPWPACPDVGTGGRGVSGNSGGAVDSTRRPS